jgi:hypothetical protein
MDMLPKDKHWLTGFRVFQAEMPTTGSLPLPAKPHVMQQYGNNNLNCLTLILTLFLLGPITMSKHRIMNPKIHFMTITIVLQSPIAITTICW